MAMQSPLGRVDRTAEATHDVVDLLAYMHAMKEGTVAVRTHWTAFQAHHLVFKDGSHLWLATEGLN